MKVIDLKKPITGYVIEKLRGGLLRVKWHNCEQSIIWKDDKRYLFILIK